MKKIEYIRPAKSKGYITLGVRDGERFISLTVSECVYADIGAPSVGDFADGGELSVLTAEDEFYRARIKAMNILAYRDNSRLSLVNKLALAGFKRETALAVADEMIERGYINEKRQLLRLVSDAVNINLMGKRKLLPKLMSKGYSRAAIEEAIDTLCECGEIDFEKSKKLLIKKKLGDSPEREEIKKLLYKSGYDVC